MAASIPLFYPFCSRSQSLNEPFIIAASLQFNSAAKKEANNQHKKELLMDWYVLIETKKRTGALEQFT